MKASQIKPSTPVLFKGKVMQMGSDPFVVNEKNNKTYRLEVREGVEVPYGQDAWVSGTLISDPHGRQHDMIVNSCFRLEGETGTPVSVRGQVMRMSGDPFVVNEKDNRTYRLEVQDGVKVPYGQEARVSGTLIPDRYGRQHDTIVTSHFDVAGEKAT